MSFTTIKIEDHDVGLRFDYPCIRWFTEATYDNPKYFDKAESLTDIGVAKLLQFAYENDCEVKEVKPNIPYEKFYEWVQERITLSGETNPELTEVVKIFLKSKPVQEQKKKQEAEKKNLTETTESTLTESSELSTVNSE